MFGDVIRALTQFGQKIIGFVRQVARDKDKIATGQTIRSLEAAERIDIANGQFEFELYGSQVFEYIESGRPAGAPMPPKGALLEWMQARGIPASAEFPIRRAIARRGIQPVPLLKTSYTDINTRFQSAVDQGALQRLGAKILEAMKNGFQFPTVKI